MHCFLRTGDESLEESTGYPSVKAAVAAYAACARELDRHGQTIDGTIHIADSREEVGEYPDFVLSLGPKGNVRKERA